MRLRHSLSLLCRRRFQEPRQQRNVQHARRRCGGLRHLPRRSAAWQLGVPADGDDLLLLLLRRRRQKGRRGGGRSAAALLAHFSLHRFPTLRLLYHQRRFYIDIDCQSLVQERRVAENV